MSEKWVPFWWESNSCFGPVNSAEDWDRMVKVYRKEHNSPSTQCARQSMVSKARLARWHDPAAVDLGSIPSVGMCAEHVGGESFSDWLEQNSMLERALSGDDLSATSIRERLRTLAAAFLS